MPLLLIAFFLAPALRVGAQAPPPPRITSFAPASGPRGTIVTLTGSNFDDVQSVEFNFNNTTNFTIVSSSQIVVTVPSSASTGPIRVSDGFVATTTTTNYTVTPGYVVTNTNDTNAGSLREGLDFANSNTDTTNINFAIPGTGVQTISPLSALPVITSPVVINGYSQTGSSVNTAGAGTGKNTVLQVELNGTNAGNAHGLHITAGGSTVRGLAINRFQQNGIFLQTRGGNTVAGNFLGTDATGILARGNGAHGVASFSDNNLIGGSTAEAGNLISANGLNGVAIENSTSTVVSGNFVGTDLSGTAPLGNFAPGVALAGSTDTVIGGTSVRQRNLISGNRSRGIAIFGASTGTRVINNYIGTDITATDDLANDDYGIIIFDANDNTVGGATSAFRNIISGNASAGIFIDTTATRNTVAGNYIGVNRLGDVKIPNGSDGVLVTAPGNIIGEAGSGNLISGNPGSGVALGGNAINTKVQSNLIGTDAAGTGDIGNGDGIRISATATGTIIGGSTTGLGNIISGNDSTGITLDGASDITVQGNSIGLTLTGAAGPVNGRGIVLSNAKNNLIGGAAAPARNVISGGEYGVLISGSSATGNKIYGNYIGTTADGSVAVPNDYGIGITGGANANQIGAASTTTGAAPGNLITASVNYNILLDNGDGNFVYGNLIGTNVGGTGRLGNFSTSAGIGLLAGSSNNTIGGGNAGERNVISGHAGDGVELLGTGTVGNQVSGNYV
ncbi:MAG TPA: NosD domain-containing protein, partial [Abditibacteriaceae bacterium]